MEEQNRQYEERRQIQRQETSANKEGETTRSVCHQTETSRGIF